MTRCDGANRRDFLHVGGLSALGLTLADALHLRAEAAASNTKLRNCILIWLDGGPSHLDTFDLKPEAPAEVRGQLKPIQTNVPGVSIGEHFKKLSKRMDKVCLIRSLTSELGVHGLGSRYVLTGYKPSPVLTYPSYGSVIAHSQKEDSVLPPYVALANARLLSYGALGNGYLPQSTRPFTVTGDPGSPSFRVRDLQVPAGLTESRLDRRRQYVSAIDNLSQRMEREGLSRVRHAQFEKAYRLILSPDAKKAFELSLEKPQVRTRYGMQYRRYSQIGHSCLLARRLIEAGCRFVTVTDAGRGGNYDMHSDIYGRLGRKLPVLDQAVSTLIEDLETRGLLDETLVVLMGEFGRTPRLNGGGGRDHWPRAFSVVLAGGGTRGGQVVGKTDPRGTSPVDDPATPADLARTIYTLIGIDPGGKFHTQDGRPIHITSGGQVIKKCLS